LPIFGEKIGVFLKYQCYDQLFSKFSFVLSQKRQFFRKFFRRKYLKNHNVGPEVTRSGEFSPIVCLFTKCRFLYITEVAQIVWLQFLTVKLMYNCSQKN
jgi:hypothetical protein